MTYREAMREARRAYLLAVLREARWCVTKAAQLAGVHRTWFYKRMAAVGIEVPRPQHRNRGNEQWRAMQ